VKLFDTALAGAWMMVGYRSFSSLQSHTTHMYMYIGNDGIRGAYIDPLPCRANSRLSIVTLSVEYTRERGEDPDTVSVASPVPGVLYNTLNCS